MRRPRGGPRLRCDATSEACAGNVLRADRHHGTGGRDRRLRRGNCGKLNDRAGAVGVCVRGSERWYWDAKRPGDAVLFGLEVRRRGYLYEAESCMDVLPHYPGIRGDLLMQVIRCLSGRSCPQKVRG